MKLKLQIPASGTALVFWGYAALALVSGVLIAAWGPMWFGTDLPALPFGKAALVRMTGAAMFAAGCFAAAMAQVPDEEARRRAMRWYALGHGALLVAALTQQRAIWNTSTGDGVVTIFTVLTICFLAFREMDNPDPAAHGLQTLFAARIPANPRRGASRYEQTIREAAGREERNRLARDLHDSIKQQLFAVQTAAATAQTRFESDPEGSRGAIAQVRSAARDAMTEMEVLLDQLRAAPLENVGLVEALKRQCEALGFRTGASVTFTLGDLPPNSSLPAGAQQALFRVAQEALSNIARHARAQNVLVWLGATTQWLKLTVEDDGAGFDTGHPPSGMGIRNMRERTAEFDGIFELTSSPAAGTTITAAIPYTLPATEAKLRKHMIAEGALLALAIVVAIDGSGAAAGIAMVWVFRFVRALNNWRSVRVAREVVR